MWYTPPLQRQFTLDSLCNLLKAKVGICCTWGDCLVGGKPVDPVMEVLAALPGRVITLTRREAVADLDWYTSQHFKQLREPLGLGPTLYVKIHAQLIERTTIVTLCRPSGAPAFTERDAYLVDLCLRFSKAPGLQSRGFIVAQLSASPVA